MRALIVACLLTFACDSSASIPPTDMDAQIADESADIPQSPVDVAPIVDTSFVAVADVSSVSDLSAIDTAATTDDLSMVDMAVASDIALCGGMACVLAHAQSNCVNGICVVASCASLFGDCDAIAANGCEHDLSGDASNCGACLNVCPVIANGVTGCNGGTCVVTFCKNPLRDCNGKVGDGCEANILSDVMNCGGCGNVCTYPNATAMCSMGGCTLGPCNHGFGNCDGFMVNGCEANTDTNSNNCGACGFICPMNNPKCNNGICTN